ncbi:MAG: hypothetical protein CMJ75_22820 [Planctomycetaceae bacterium]|nr:hypothetical protein [Planctomycetaceae bacterium]
MDVQKKKKRIPVKSRVHRAQRLILEDRETRYRAFVGGIGSGKTYTGCLDLIQTRADRSLVLAPTYPMLKDGALSLFLELFGALIRKHNKAFLKTELLDGREILWRPADVNNLERLRGINAGYLWVDEGASLTRKAWNVAIGRIRRTPGRALVTTTPRGLNNWVHDVFVKEAGSSSSLVQCATSENVWLPEGWIQSVRGQYTSRFALQELEGQFLEEDAQGLFDRQWFRVVESAPETPSEASVRHWDLASTSGPDSDWSASALLSRRSGRYTLTLERYRLSWLKPDRAGKCLKETIVQTALADGQDVQVSIEAVSGFEHSFEEISLDPRLQGWRFRKVKPCKTKVARAMRLAAKAEAGLVCLVRNRASEPFLTEAEDFPKKGAKNDMVDAASGAYNALRGGSGLQVGSTRPAPGHEWTPQTRQERLQW